MQNAKTVRRVNVGLIGLGTVGGGTLQLLAQNSRLIADRASEIVVKRVWIFLILKPKLPNWGLRKLRPPAIIMIW